MATDPQPRTAASAGFNLQGFSLLTSAILISVLLGVFAAGELAGGQLLLPGAIVMSVLLFAGGAYAASRLPSNAAPGARAESRENSAPASTHITLAQCLREISSGFAYAASHAGVLALTLLELACWAAMAALLALFASHAQEFASLRGIDAPRDISRALGCAGMGLLAGAGGVSFIRYKASPIVTYTLTFLLLALGTHGLFRFNPEWASAMLFLIGLGAGMALGRVDADILAAVEPEFHGRVFCAKALACAAAILIAFAGLEGAPVQERMRWLPRLLLFALPAVFVLSWLGDMAVYARMDINALFLYEGRREFPGPLHRFGYRLLRAAARAILKGIFRYEPLDAANVPETGGVVLAANHGSFIDPLLMACGTERVIQYVVYSSYYRSLAHPLFRFLRCIPVEENDELGALRAGVRALKLGACIGIFPEGRVSDDGKLKAPMRGALFLAQHSGAPVVGVALKGDTQALARGEWLPHPVKVAPIYGKPFAVDKGLSKHDTAELTDRLMAELAKKLDLEAPPSTAEKEKDTAEKERDER